MPILEILVALKRSIVLYKAVTAVFYLSHYLISHSSHFSHSSLLVNFSLSTIESLLQREIGFQSINSCYYCHNHYYSLFLSSESRFSIQRFLSARNVIIFSNLNYQSLLLSSNHQY